MTLPFVLSVDKAHEAVRRINRAADEEGVRPIIFSTLVQDELRAIVVEANGLFLDMFSAFVGPLERELNVRSTHRAGRALSSRFRSVKQPLPVLPGRGPSPP